MKTTHCPSPASQVSTPRRIILVGVSPAKVSPLGGRVPAYLVVPAGRGPFAATLFGHWMMKGSPFCNRRGFLEEAGWLVKRLSLKPVDQAALTRIPVLQ